MCLSSGPSLPTAAPAPPASPDAPQVLDQKVAGAPQETHDEQLLALQLGLNQLRILPGTFLTGGDQ